MQYSSGLQAHVGGLCSVFHPPTPPSSSPVGCSQFATSSLFALGIALPHVQVVCQDFASPSLNSDESLWLSYTGDGKEREIASDLYT